MGSENLWQGLEENFVLRNTWTENHLPLGASYRSELMLRQQK